MNKYEVWLKKDKEKEQSLYGEYDSWPIAQSVVESILLTTKNVKRCYIAHIANPGEPSLFASKPTAMDLKGEDFIEDAFTVVDRSIEFIKGW